MKRLAIPGTLMILGITTLTSAPNLYKAPEKPKEILKLEEINTNITEEQIKNFFSEKSFYFKKVSNYCSKKESQKKKEETQSLIGAITILLGATLGITFIGRELIYNGIE